MAIFGREFIEPGPAALPDEPEFWHGTRAYIRPGQKVLPGSVVGKPANFLDGDVTGTWVYITTARHWAEFFALLAKGAGAPKVMRVRPLTPPMRVEAGYAGMGNGAGQTFAPITMPAYACGSARVLEVLPVADHDDFAQPSPDMRSMSRLADRLLAMKPAGA